MKRQELEDLLKGMGYDVEYRHCGWRECLVAGHGEAWTGSGVTGDAALQNALQKMFPSHAAMALMQKTFRMEPGETVKAPKGHLTPKTIRATLQVPLEPPTPNAKTRTVAPVPPTPLPTPAPSAPSVSAPEENPSEPSMSLEDALDRLNELIEELKDAAEDAAVMTAMNLRYNVALWMFQARAVQEARPGDEEVTEVVHQIARQLTSICKLYWPGSVRALQVWTIPSQALDGLVRTSRSPSTWAEATDMLQAEMETFDRRPGHDEYGWTDLAELVPEPSNAGAVLREATGKIETVLGTVSGPPNVSPQAAEVLANLEELVLAAHLLRWVRRCISDRREWGLAMGALRWAAREYAPGSETLREVIDDEFRPSSSWAQLLGRDPRVNEQERLQQELMERRPEVTWDEGVLLGWLRQAFQVFTNPQIAKMAGATRDLILTFTNEDFSDADRSTRTRLRKLQAIYRCEHDVSSVALPEQDELETQEKPEASPQTPDPGEQLLACVRELTEGKRMLFVSNRADQLLRARLERDLGCQVTLRDGSTPRQIRSIMDNVSVDRYDFVVMAQGFNSHNADSGLCRAAKSAGIPYVRVNKGRPLATVRALARLMNVKISDESATAAHASRT